MGLGQKTPTPYPLGKKPPNSEKYKLMFFINIVLVKIQGCNELKCRAAKSLESCEKIQRHRKKNQNVLFNHQDSGIC
jgi:hypothetical protein